MSDLQVQVVSREAGAVVVTLVGAADIAGAGTLERRLTFLSARHPAVVVFDCAQVSFISSLAMGVLMAFRRGCVAWGGRVALAAPSPMVAGAFKHAGLEKLLPIADSVEAALAQATTTK